MHFTDPKDQRIKQLENENKNQQDIIKRLQYNVEALTQAILYAAKKRFGASSEKTQPTGKYTLWGDEAGDIVTTDNAPVINIKEHKRPVRKKGDREKLIAALPRETIECVLNSEEAHCGICNSELKVIGKKKVRSEMEYIPARLVMKDYV